MPGHILAVKVEETTRSLEVMATTSKMLQLTLTGELNVRNVVLYRVLGYICIHHCNGFEL